SSPPRSGNNQPAGRRLDRPRARPRPTPPPWPRHPPAPRLVSSSARPRRRRPRASPPPTPPRHVPPPDHPTRTPSRPPPHRARPCAVGEYLAGPPPRDILVDIGRHRGPQKSLFALGYAGWGAGQLEGEIARRDWFSAPADPELVFDADRARLWERALASRSR